MDQVNKFIVKGYKMLIDGMLTSEEYFNHVYGIFHGLKIMNINTDIQLTKLKQLKNQYESIVYNPGRQLIDKEMEIIKELSI